MKYRIDNSGIKYTPQSEELVTITVDNAPAFQIRVLNVMSFDKMKLAQSICQALEAKEN